MGEHRKEQNPKLIADKLSKVNEYKTFNLKQRYTDDQEKNLTIDRSKSEKD